MTNNEITFDNLPEAVGYLVKEIGEIKQYISQQRKSPQNKESPIGIEEACKVIGKARSTIYTLVQKRIIPCYKIGKKLYFYEDELLNWIATGRRKSTAETTAELEAEIFRDDRKRSRKLNF